MRKGMVVGVCLLCALGFGSAGSAAAATPPANDDFANAQVLSGPLPLTVSGTTVGATREAGEPTPPESTPSGHSIWFTWEAPSTEYVSVDTCGSEPRTILSVYTGTTVGELTEVASNWYSYAPDCVSGGSEVTFTAHAGTTYSVSVDGDGFEAPSDPSSTGEGPIELELSHPPRPANDDFANAEPIAAGELSFPIDNWGATKESGEPDHRGNRGGASVWFDWTAPRTGGAIFGACDLPLGKEAVVAVYTGSAVSALTPVPPIDVATTSCSYAFFATAGVTYRIAYDGVFDPAADAAEMFDNQGHLNLFPGNDDFENAASLNNPFEQGPFSNALVVGYGNVGATKQPGEPNHAGNSGGASVWFTWRAPETGSVQMNACEATFPTLLAVYTGSSLSGLTPVASDTGPPGIGCPGNSTGVGEVGFNIDAGTTYDIAVDGMNGAWGRFNLEMWESTERVKVPVTEPTPLRPKARIARRRIEQARRTAVFSLRSTVADSTFRCRLDRRALRTCHAKVTYRHLAFGRHVFRAFAVSPTGLAAKKPATVTFRIAGPSAHRRHRG